MAQRGRRKPSSPLKTLRNAFRTALTNAEHLNHRTGLGAILKNEKSKRGLQGPARHLVLK